MAIITSAREHKISVQDIELIGGSVARLKLLPEDPETFFYREGQYLNLVLPGGHMRAYSFASPCRKGEVFELHIRLHEGGRFSELIKQTLRKNDILTAVAPFGDCLWHPPADNNAPVIMLATGTGIAPLKAFLEAELPSCPAPIWLYWGGRTAVDLYLIDYFSGLADQYAHFNFIPVLSRETNNLAAHGFVQQAAARHHADMSRSQVYACGSPRMIEAAKVLLTESRGLPQENFHADAFEAAWERSVADAQAGEGQVVELWVTAADGIRRKLRLQEGASLMLALRDAGLMYGVCGSRQSCGTCRVTIGRAGALAPPSRSELRLLKTLTQPGDNDRLACQLPVNAGLCDAEIFIPDDPVSRMKRQLIQT
ncbi:MAG: 2Fe-2S iron-sulfur cluster binding domain-containing protein [Rhodospirillales bacterium]|nr:2Fe-2S iron-sulfur cluster binding domain-containing protein [Rhodospirillales bacterium]